jgi:hypothetical protein
MGQESRSDPRSQGRDPGHPIFLGRSNSRHAACFPWDRGHPPKEGKEILGRMGNRYPVPLIPNRRSFELDLARVHRTPNSWSKARYSHIKNTIVAVTSIAQMRI